MEKTYSIVFDPLDPRFDPLAIKRLLRDDPDITHWWNHLANYFIVTTKQSARSVTRKLREKTDNVSFLVSRLDLSDSEGSLPARSWDWIVARERNTAG